MIRRLSILLLVSFIAGAALADSPQNGTIDGTVVDASGTALPGVTVTLGSDRGDKSTRHRRGRQVPVRPAAARRSTPLRASLEGFEPTEQAVVARDRAAAERSTLRLGLGTSEEIAVIAETPHGRQVPGERRRPRSTPRSPRSSSSPTATTSR